MSLVVLKILIPNIVRRPPAGNWIDWLRHTLVLPADRDCEATQKPKTSWVEDGAGSSRRHPSSPSSLLRFPAALLRILLGTSPYFLVIFLEI